MAKLKVYGGVERGRGKSEVRTIVATTSQKRAAEILGLSLSAIRNYYDESGCELELKVALAEPESVFQASTSRGNDFIKVDFR